MICRATAKEKSRRTADISTRLYYLTVALIFRAAVSFCLSETNDDPTPYKGTAAHRKMSLCDASAVQNTRKRVFFLEFEFYGGNIMNKAQLNAAQEAMIDWLSDPHELGKTLIRLNVLANLILTKCIIIFSSLKQAYSASGLLVYAVVLRMMI